MALPHAKVILNFPLSLSISSSAIKLIFMNMKIIIQIQQYGYIKHISNIKVAIYKKAI